MSADSFDATAELWVGAGIDLPKEVRAEEMVDGCAVAVVEFPAAGQHQRIDHRYRDQVFELLQLSEDQRAVCPGAGIGDVQVVATGFGLVAGGARRACRSVGGNPIAEGRGAALEMAGGRFRVIPDVLPDAVYEHSHGAILVRSQLALKIRRIGQIARGGWLNTAFFHWTQNNFAAIGNSARNEKAPDDRSTDPATTLMLTNAKRRLREHYCCLSAGFGHP